jgi:Xaa-Pro aminopeptidase
MVFVLEPVIWRDGVGGYRSEEIVTVTDSGFELLSSYGYTPFA